MDYDLLQTIAAFAQVLATIGVVGVGVWLSRYLERRNRPTLELLYDGLAELDNKYLPPEATHDNSEEIWIKVRVHNTSETIARDVGLRLLWIKREGDTWDNRPAWWFKVSNLNIVSTHIYPAFIQPFDIAHVKNRVSEPDDLGCFLTLVTPEMDEWPEEKLKIEQSKYNRIYNGRQYTMLLALLCSNADAKYYKLVLNVLAPLPADPATEGIMGSAAIRKRISCTLVGEIDPSQEKEPLATLPGSRATTHGHR